MQHTNHALPEPLTVPWELKPVSSARSGAEVLSDKRLKLWIKHDLLKGVTPAMLVWWFSNLEGDVDIEGQLLNRYRVSHPFDHVYARYARRLPDGLIGPGAQIHLRDYFARNPKHKVEFLTTIEKLDEEGYVHNPVIGRISLARMEYTFREVAGGTLYESALIVPRGRRSWFLRKVAVPILFPEEKGQAWTTHTTSRRSAASRTSSPTSTAGRPVSSRRRPPLRRQKLRYRASVGRGSLGLLPGSPRGALL